MNGHQGCQRNAEKFFTGTHASQAQQRVSICKIFDQKPAHRLPPLRISCYAVSFVDGTVAAAHLEVVVVMAVIPDEGAIVDELQLLQSWRPL